jgi:hypothetical protein
MGRPMVFAGDEVSASLLAGYATADDVGLCRQADCSPSATEGSPPRVAHDTTSTTFCRSGSRTHLVAKKWTYPHRLGRPPLDEVSALLTKQMAREKLTWGYKRIQGELLTLRPSDGGLDRPQCPYAPADISGADPVHRHNLAAVPAHVGLGDAGL